MVLIRWADNRLSDINMGYTAISGKGRGQARIEESSTRVMWTLKSDAFGVLWSNGYDNSLTWSGFPVQFWVRPLILFSKFVSPVYVCLLMVDGSFLQHDTFFIASWVRWVRTHPKKEGGKEKKNKKFTSAENRTIAGYILSGRITAELGTPRVWSVCHNQLDHGCRKIEIWRISLIMILIGQGHGIGMVGAYYIHIYINVRII